LFWFKRYQDALYPAVHTLMQEAKARGLDAHVVEAETFDELFADIIRFLPETEKEVGRIAGATRPRRAKIVPRASVANIPAIRTNALPIVSYPAICRLAVCDIGGPSEVQEAINKSGLDIIAMRAKPGVLAFGSDADIRKAFEPFKITSFDTHAISPNQLIGATGTRALLRSAVFRALGRRPGLLPTHRGQGVRARLLLYPNPALVKPSDFNSRPLRSLASYPEFRSDAGKGCKAHANT
jgi:hypothetical protein